MSAGDVVMPFYGADQAAIHHRDFGDLAAVAARRLLDELAAAGLTGGTVVDLACGSGILARIVSDAGFDVLGVDISPAMIELARTNAPDATFVNGSLHDLALPAAVAVTATGEALNYATDERAGLGAVQALFRRIHAVLDPRGVVLGDVAMPGRLGGVKQRTQVHDRLEWTLHMVADESADGTRLDRRIVVFARNDDGTYRRTDEHHVLRLYAAGDLRAALGRAGFVVALGPRYSEAASRSTPPAGWTVFVARPQPAGPA